MTKVCVLEIDRTEFSQNKCRYCVLENINYEITLLPSGLLKLVSEIFHLGMDFC